MRLIVTGGAGFIGSSLVFRALKEGHEVLTIDKLTYAARPETMSQLSSASNHEFLRAGIEDAAAMNTAFEKFEPDAVLHLAAESHVDRSIDEPEAFIKTNINGTFVLLETALRYWSRLSGPKHQNFLFLQVSTDEVFGALGEHGSFSLSSPYAPNSPYAACKAAGDHLARAWQHTYRLPLVVTNCSNNYGPRQHPEKLIPTVIRHALARERIPIYGNGRNVRDWLYVDDHVAGLLAAIQNRRPGETFLFGGRCEVRNIDLARLICQLLDQRVPQASERSYAEQIEFVVDRPGHDLRYSIDPSHAETVLGWKPTESLESGLKKTIEWYLANPDWLVPGKILGRLGQRPLKTSE
jgi:dTDP-glucose 4,6-dehydratase